jgi:hypothetical protein
MGNLLNQIQARPPPAPTPVTPVNAPPHAVSPQRDAGGGGGGGFNTDMLQRAAESNSKPKNNDDEEDGWSDEEEKPVITSPKPVVTSPKPQVETSHRSASYSVPTVSKPPPSRFSQASVPILKENSIETPTDLPNSNSQIPINSPMPDINNNNSSTFNNDNIKETNEKETDILLSPKIERNRTSSTSLPEESVSTANMLRERNRLKELESEVFELRNKLERAESILSQQSGLSGSLRREAALEKDLDMAYDKINLIKSEKSSLETSVKALQLRLTLAESQEENVVTPHTDSVLMQSALKNSEREKDLETQLLKAKRDKDKAIRLVIRLIGKERVAEFLLHSSGSTDVLDALVETFSGVGLSGSTQVEPPASPMNIKSPKKGHGTPSKFENRSSSIQESNKTREEKRNLMKNIKKY